MPLHLQADNSTSSCVYAMSGPIDSEESFIARYLRPLSAGAPGAFGLLDDAAVISCGEGEDLVVTTDSVAAGVHFFKGDAPDDVAFKALAVNVSDLVAKGASPYVYLMSLALPETPQALWMEGFVSGLHAAQDEFAITLVGGDTDRRPGPLTVSITAIGRVPKGRMVRRTTARQGHHLFLSGQPGMAALGLALRRDPGLATVWGLTTSEAGELLSAYARPAPPVLLRQSLLDHAQASIDISDGLAKDLLRMCTASGVGATVDGRLLNLSATVSKIVACAPDRIFDVVSGGEDYQVLAAVAPEHAARFQQDAAACGVLVADIGRLDRREGLVIRDLKGDALDLPRLGWDHLRPD